MFIKKQIYREEHYVHGQKTMYRLVQQIHTWQLWVVSSHSEKHSLPNGAYSVRRRPSRKKKEGARDTKDRRDPKEHPDTTLLNMVHNQSLEGSERVHWRDRRQGLFQGEGGHNVLWP